MNDEDKTKDTALTLELDLKSKKTKINLKKMLINSCIIFLIAILVLTLVFLVSIAKNTL